MTTFPPPKPTEPSESPSSASESTVPSLTASSHSPAAPTSLAATSPGTSSPDTSPAPAVPASAATAFFPSSSAAAAAPTSASAPSAPATPAPPPSRLRRARSLASPGPLLIPGGRGLAVFFGILLPVIALTVELVTGMCQGFLDPVPTLGHAITIGFVPFAHLLALLSLRAAARPGFVRLAAWSNAIALGIGLVFTAYFVPVLPFAVIGILAFGLGLLPLAPLTSVIAALCLRTGLRRQARAQGQELKSLWSGLAIGLLALAALEGPAALTTYGVRQLTHSEAPAQASALRLLRRFGSESHLLAGAYSHFGDSLRQSFFNTLAGGAPSEADYQHAYYRVTGRLFNSVPAPRPSGFGRGDTDTSDWVWDNSLGTQAVGQRLRALAVTESRLDARVDGEAALGYLEWTLVFRNDHTFNQREARAVIQLPPGATVSRLTLWVHGEEREAAWGGPAKVIEAYRAVAVVQRRDPVLVTAQGPDRVLIQCFPIEPNGGTMKVRLGITVPLALDEGRRAHLILPRFIEQNFSVPETFVHQLWVDSDLPLTPALPSLGGDSTLAGVHTLRGPLTTADLDTHPAVLSLTRSARLSTAWTPALRDPTRIVTQTLRLEPPSTAPVALVISGSSELAPAALALADLLAANGARTPFFQVFVAGDALASSPPGQEARAQAHWLSDQTFAGGQDDTTALSAAFDALATRGGGTLVWLHGGQPASWQNAEALEQRFERRPGFIRLLSVPALAAPNLLLEKIAGPSAVSTFPRFADLTEDLTRLSRTLRDGHLIAVREAVPSADFSRKPAAAATRTSDHLSRLWARDEVLRLLASGASTDRETAQRLALAAQIVTPVSGAVVLENQAQYDAAGLKPAGAENSPQNSPVVPEPAAYGFILGTILLGLTALRRRRA